MKRLILFFILCSAVSGRGQITITAAQFLTGFSSGEASGRGYTSDNVSGLSALIAASGASQTWDFGGRVYTEVQTVPGTLIEVFAFPGSAPFSDDPDLATTTHVLKISIPGSEISATYSYVRFTDQGFWMVGGAYDSMGSAKKLNVYVPPKQQYAFPLSYQTSWSSNSTVKNPLYPPGVTITEQVEAKVDAYGNLVLPTRAGKQGKNPASSTESLRIEAKNTQTIDYGGFGFASTTMSYDWITLTHYSANIYADSSKTPISVGYNTPGSSGDVNVTAENLLELRLGANPVGAETNIFFKLEDPLYAQVGLIDMKGNNVQRVYAGIAQSGINMIPLNVQSLPNGTYFLRLEAGSMRAIHKLVIAK